jgi:lipopolysaccharide transport protein LptA
MKKAVVYSLLMLISPLSADAPLGESAFDMISISADEAIEDEQPGILHLKGHFLMQSENWHLTSARAIVHGSPNKPDRVILEGAPARFLVYPTSQSLRDPIEATALVVEYVREANKLSLSGEATLILGDEIIRSTSIEYDIDSNRYRAGGSKGVSIKVPPVD